MHLQRQTSDGLPQQLIDPYHACIPSLGVRSWVKGRGEGGPGHMDQSHTLPKHPG